MRVWLDLANSPHVPLLSPVAERLREEGDDVLVTAREHAQTVDLARRSFPDVEVIGGESPPGRVAKGRSVLSRAGALWRFARRQRPDVAFSHGSYAQLVASSLAGVRAVTMMDYEHQPANHLSFRLAERVIVPAAFPEAALRRFGAQPWKVLRYPGFKEELYLSEVNAHGFVLRELDLDPGGVIVVMRPPPRGALYHRMGNGRFEQLLRLALEREGVQVVVLPRTQEQAKHYRAISSTIRIPAQTIDGSSVLAAADVVIGAGGTMSREAAVLGTPTYTVFARQLPAVDRKLIEMGRLYDLRAPGTQPTFEKKEARRRGIAAQTAPIILATVVEAIEQRPMKQRARPRPFEKAYR